MHACYVGVHSIFIFIIRVINESCKNFPKTSALIGLWWTSKIHIFSHHIKIQKFGVPRTNGCISTTFIDIHKIVPFNLEGVGSRVSIYRWMGRGGGGSPSTWRGWDLGYRSIGGWGGGGGGGWGGGIGILIMNIREGMTTVSGLSWETLHQWDGPGSCTTYTTHFHGTRTGFWFRYCCIYKWHTPEMAFFRHSNLLRRHIWSVQNTMYWTMLL